MWHLWLSTVVVGSLSAGTGETGFAFLKIGVDARAAGMGEAMSSVSTDATAWYWNPAGLAMSDRSGVVFTHNQWIEDVRHNFIGLKLNSRGHYVGLHYLVTGVTDIQQREIPSDNPTALFDSHDLALGLTYARQMNDRWAIGANMTYVYERIQESVDALAFDVGLWYNVKYVFDNDGMDRRWRVGFVLSNCGVSGKMAERQVDLPRTARLGSSFDIMRSEEGRHRMTVATDIVKPVAESIRWHVGAEYAFREKIFVRAGYQMGYESRSISGGIGMAVLNRVRLDYAAVPFRYALGMSHRVTASFDF